MKSAVKSLSKPLGGLLAFGLGVAGFCVPAMHSLGSNLSTALIVAGLGAYGISLGIGSGGSSGKTPAA